MQVNIACSRFYSEYNFTLLPPKLRKKKSFQTGEKKKKIVTCSVQSLSPVRLFAYTIACRTNLQTRTEFPQALTDAPIRLAF